MENEKRLIDANVMLHDMCKRCNIENEVCPCEPPDCFIYDVITNATTVDAVEVVHGKWIEHRPNIYECTACRTWYGNYGGNEEWRYCPNCGAKMDGDG